VVVTLKLQLQVRPAGGDRAQQSEGGRERESEREREGEIERETGWGE